MSPTLLVALVPRNRYLVLAAPLLDFWPFFVVRMVRLALTDPLFYLFGRWYGDGASDGGGATSTSGPSPPAPRE